MVLGFRQQAALTKNRKWSQINTTLYSMCFTTSFRGGVSRCELCLGSMHSTADCALQGDPDPDMRDRVKAVEVALVSRQRRQAGDQPTQRENQVCRLFNQGRCNFAKCKYIHECLQCRGLHPVSRCQRRGPSGGEPGGLPPRPFRNPECSSGSYRPCQPNRVYLGLVMLYLCMDQCFLVGNMKSNR